MFYAIVVVMLCFFVMQLVAFSKVVNAEFGSMKNYMDNLTKNQNNKRIKQFTKKLFYQTMILGLSIFVFLVVNIVLVKNQ